MDNSATINPNQNGSQNEKSSNAVSAMLKHPAWLEFQKFLQPLVLAALLIGFGYQQFAIEYLRQQVSKLELPVSTPSQTSQGLQGSDVPGGYTGNKTHLHSPVNIQQKHGDRSPLYRVSK
jgi:hypothetical protein